MNLKAPFQPSDLSELGEFLGKADRVVPMRDIAKGDTGERVIGLRHDVDDNEGSLLTALRMAEWEFEHGWSSTYFLLHGSHYWGDEMIVAAGQLEELGHEVGIHVNAIAEALRTGGKNPHLVLLQALDELRGSVRVVGSVAHGDDLCHKAMFVNDEIFEECHRPTMGARNRAIEFGARTVHLSQMPLSYFELEYDANWLSRGDYLSDSGGKWSQPFESVVEAWPDRGQLHMLVHPDWWAEAFLEVAVT